MDALATVDDGREPSELHLGEYCVLLVREPQLLHEQVVQFLIRALGAALGGVIKTRARTTGLDIVLVRLAQRTHDGIAVLVDDGYRIFLHTRPTEHVHARHDACDEVLLEAFEADPAVEKCGLSELQGAALLLEVAVLPVILILKLKGKRVDVWGTLARH